MKPIATRVAAVMLLLLVVPDVSVSNDDNGKGRPFRARLTGLQEVPAISSKGVGEFEARLSDDKATLDYKLEWKDLEGAAVTQAHIHFAQPGVNGGIMVWLCDSATNNSPISTTPLCGPPQQAPLKEPSLPQMS